MIQVRRNLLYFSVFRISPEHYNQLSISLTSIALSTSSLFRIFDIMILCDKYSYTKIQSLRTILYFKMYIIHENAPNMNALMNRYLIYTVPNIVDIYDICCYSDIDIVYVKNLNALFRKQYTDNKIYAVCECMEPKCHESYWHSLQVYTPLEYDKVKNRCAANSGFFIFKNTFSNINMLKGIVELYSEFMKISPDNTFTDQSYMNHYCLLKNVLDTSLLENTCQFIWNNDIHVLSSTHFLHFVGMGRRNKSVSMQLYLTDYKRKRRNNTIKIVFCICIMICILINVFYFNGYVMKHIV